MREESHIRYACWAMRFCSRFRANLSCSDAKLVLCRLLCRGRDVAIGFLFCALSALSAALSPVAKSMFGLEACENSLNS